MSVLQTQKLDPYANARDMGIFAKRGGPITVGVQLDEYFKWLKVATGGDVVVQGIDSTIWVQGLLDGQMVPVIGNKVLASGGGGSTTATGITWGGGQ